MKKRSPLGVLKSVLKQKSGMTLIETVVTFIIAGILIAATGALIITGLNLYQDTAARNLDKQIGDSVLENVSNKLLYAKSIEKGPQSSPLDMEMIGTAGGIFVGIDESSPQERGYLFFKEPGEGKTFSAAYPKDFYSGRQIEMTLKVDKVTGTKAVTLSIKVYDEGEAKYQRSTSLQLLNCGAYDEPTATGPAWPPQTLIDYTLVE